MPLDTRKGTVVKVHLLLLIILYLTNRFHLAARVYSDSAPMTPKLRIKKWVTTFANNYNTTGVLTTF